MIRAPTALIALLTCAVPHASQATEPPKPIASPWVATWSNGLVQINPGTPGTFNNMTLRQVLHTSVGGAGVRVRLTNAWGVDTLSLGTVHIAHSLGNGQIDPATDVTLTFGGNTAVDIAAGAIVVSDPVSETFPAQYDLAVSLYLTATNVYTEHPLALATTYIAQGNQAGAATLTNPQTSTQRYYIEAVDVAAVQPQATVVALGDSITDGYFTYNDTNQRWPDLLAARLVTKYGNKVGVVNTGIAGNTLLIPYSAGLPAVARFNDDVVSQPGRHWVAILEGINDIADYYYGYGTPPTAAQLIAGFQSLVARAHDSGMLVYGATVTPFLGCAVYTAAGEQVREALNAYIRTAGSVDAVADTDKVLRDPQQPTALNPAYDSGDHLHPNPAGMQVIANSFDLKTLEK